MKKRIKLKTIVVERELKSRGKSKYWLARQCNVAPQLVLYWLDSQSQAGIVPISNALDVEWTELAKVA